MIVEKLFAERRIEIVQSRNNPFLSLLAIDWTNNTWHDKRGSDSFRLWHSHHANALALARLWTMLNCFVCNIWSRMVLGSSLAAEQSIYRCRCRVDQFRRVRRERSARAQSSTNVRFLFTYQTLECITEPIKCRKWNYVCTHKINKSKWCLHDRSGGDGGNGGERASIFSKRTNDSSHVGHAAPICVLISDEIFKSNQIGYTRTCLVRAFGRLPHIRSDECQLNVTKNIATATSKAQTNALHFFVHR